MTRAGVLDGRFEDIISCDEPRHLLREDWTTNVPFILRYVVRCVDLDMRGTGWKASSLLVFCLRRGSTLLIMLFAPPPLGRSCNPMCPGLTRSGARNKGGLEREPRSFLVGGEADANFLTISSSETN